MKDDRALKAFLDYYRTEKAHLEKEQKAYNRQLRKEKNLILKTFKNDLADMNEGGKLLRGMLVDLGYRIAGGKNPGKSDDLALAFEIFQTAVLVHDDIIDHAETRRGKLTIHRRYEHRLHVRGLQAAAGEANEDVANAAALCVGDIGLYLANMKLAEGYADHPNFGKLLTYFDEVILNTMRGELLDVVLPYELQDEIYSEEERKALLEKSVGDIYRLKTAHYSIVGPLHLGMMLAGASDADLRAADRFAEDVGVAFQIMDDILGIYAEPETLGKDVGSDISEFKQTILWMYVRTRCPEYTEKLLQYYGKPEITEEDLEQVREIFRESGALAYAKDSMNACFKRAGGKLSRMKFLSDEDREIMRGFLVYLQGRRK
ncbi:MAG: polyprenyl synthetase family protein [Lachnospiraceae bacterium]|nr:polyprenyl synthetase family protein [Lachnospiraceae bacterium]